MPSDAPPGFFTCLRQPGGLTISAATCAQLYRRGLAADPGAAVHCRGCPIGAEHAGRPLPDATRHLSCCWCGKSLGEAGRLVLGQTLCPSCHARLGEYARQRYRRRSPTGVAHRLHVFIVQVEEPADDPDPGCAQP